MFLFSADSVIAVHLNSAYLSGLALVSPPVIVVWHSLSNHSFLFCRDLPLPADFTSIQHYRLHGVGCKSVGFVFLTFG